MTNCYVTGTRYKFRVAAENRHGISQESQAVTTRMLEEGMYYKNTLIFCFSYFFIEIKCIHHVSDFCSPFGRTSKPRRIPEKFNAT